MCWRDGKSRRRSIWRKKYCGQVTGWGLGLDGGRREGYRCRERCRQIERIVELLNEVTTKKW